MVAIIVCIPPFWLEGGLGWRWGGWAGGGGWASDQILKRGAWQDLNFYSCATHCHSLYHSLSFVVTRCHSLSLVVTRCHSLPLVVLRCHSLSLVVPLVVTCCTICCHSLSFIVPLVVIRCHSMYQSFVFLQTIFLLSSLIINRSTSVCNWIFPVEKQK